MPRPLMILSQSVYLIHVVDINSEIKWQTVQIQISWLLQKPTDLDLHYLQKQGISGLSRTRINFSLSFGNKFFPFRVDPFSKGSQNKFERVTSLESVQISLNQSVHLYRSTDVIPCPFRRYLQSTSDYVNRINIIRAKVNHIVCIYFFCSVFELYEN